MKIKILILFLSLFITNLIYSQVAFRDASTLKHTSTKDNNMYSVNITKDNINTILPVLYQYLKDDVKADVDSVQNIIAQLDIRINSSNSTDSLNAAQEKLAKLPLLVNYFRQSFQNTQNPYLKISTFQQSKDIGSVNEFSTESKSLTNGLDISKVADGLAKFLVQRAKEELTVAFFDRFKDVMDEYPEFATLFPNTKANLDLIESFNFSTYLKTLRIDFFKDLENLPITLPDLEKLTDSKCIGDNKTQCKKRIAAYTDFFSNDEGLIFKLCLGLIQQLKQGSNPAQILTSISENSNFTSLNGGNPSDIKSAVFLADMISTSLLSSDDDRIWISGSEIKKAFKDRKTLKIYLGLIYQLDSEDKVIFNQSRGTKTLRQILKGISTVIVKIDQFEDYIGKVADEMDEIKSSIDNIRKIKDQNLNPSMTDYYSLYSSITSFMSTATDLSNMNIVLPNQKKIDDFIGYMNSAGGIYQDFASKNYSGAIMDIRLLLNDLDIKDDASPFLREFFKYGTFMAAIVEAEDSDQVQAVIESIALPSGSAAIKRRSRVNISLNGYLGFAYGEEKNGSTDKKKNIFGMSAPIGIAASVGLDVNKPKGGGALTLFVSLIDVGALTNFRFNDSETAELPELKVENIFAPGAYVLYGFRRLPISIGGGYQYGPQLREINSTNATLNNPTGSWRVMIAVDIPLLNFYTKSK